MRVSVTCSCQTAKAGWMWEVTDNGPQCGGHRKPVALLALSQAWIWQRKPEVGIFGKPHVSLESWAGASQRVEIYHDHHSTTVHFMSSGTAIEALGNRLCDGQARHRGRCLVVRLCAGRRVASKG